MLGELVKYTFQRGVPAPGEPEEYPYYLKPLPVNYRDVKEELEKVLRAEKPVLTRWLYSTWNAEREAIKYQEIRNALSAGAVPSAWLEQWQKDYTNFVNEVWSKSALASITRAGGLYIDALGGSFNPGTQSIVNWITNRGGFLITNFTEQQRKAVQHIIRWGIEQGISADELARYLRPVIGLNTQQELAVINFRNQLMKELQEQGLTGKALREAVEKKVQDYAGWLNRRRARTIADTELSFAYNQGQLEAMKQLTEPGAPLQGERIYKIWRTKGAEVCPACQELEGEMRELDDDFSAGISAPPLHPRCYCILEFKREGAL